MYTDTPSLEVFWKSSKAKKSKDCKEWGAEGNIRQIYKAKTNECTDNCYFLTPGFFVTHGCVHTLMNSVSLKLFPNL